MPSSDQIIDAPLSLGSFFPADSDDEDNDDDEGGLDQCYEVQNVQLAGMNLRVRQYAWHSHNANKVWPGTFNLADYLFANIDGNYVHQWGSVLELGTATGLLAIRLYKSMRPMQAAENDDRDHVNGSEPSSMSSQTSPLEATEMKAPDRTFVCTSIVTSDVDDECGDVRENVHHNFELNGVPKDSQPIHVPHTWGTGWDQTKAGTAHFDTIVASDILLYVSAYAALVQTLVELMPIGASNKFIMSWNRRMKESSEFFDRMDDKGFTCEHLGKCVYQFIRKGS